MHSVSQGPLNKRQKAARARESAVNRATVAKEGAVERAGHAREAAVERAAALAKDNGARLFVVTATEPFPIIYGREWRPSLVEARRFEEENDKAAAEVFAKVEAAAAKLGVPVETVHVPNQSASAAIVETCQSAQCNLIVMSSHGRSGISRALLGSQTSNVLAQSKVPVLVVR